MRLQGAHDDPVVEVSWLLCSLPVSWTPKRQPFRLLGLVNASPTDEPHNIHFTQVEYSLAGNFTCEVSTANDVARQTYFLHVVDAFSSPYKTNVHVFEMINNSSGIKEENKFQYEVDGSDPSQNVNFENAACTLVWTFSTPAIFPRPNVTCGYYSLTMMMLSTAFLPASPCTSLIMVPGRPPLTLPILRSLTLRLPKPQPDPQSRVKCGVALMAMLLCSLINKHDWNLELSCSENDIGWRATFKNLTSSLTSLPYCEPRVFGSAHVHAGSTYVLLALLSLAAIFNL
ncbi:hypothetical protein Hamer_G027568 [Homarus americanus]|nr:hypothetical protein Hamer_G027568 [Homarus americanus]